MTLSRPAALMLGGAGRYPYNGTFRRHWSQGEVRIDVAGRLAASSAPEKTWPAVVLVHQALAEVGGADRLSALRSVWEGVLTLPRHLLAPAQGGDLSLLMVASDPAGTSVAGVGLTQVWRWSPQRVTPLVPPGHPLPAPPGIPPPPPGALTLDEPLSGPLVAAAAGARSPLPKTPDEALRRCGVTP